MIFISSVSRLYLVRILSVSRMYPLNIFYKYSNILSNIHLYWGVWQKYFNRGLTVKQN